MNELYKHHFPLLQQDAHDKPLVYLDSGATAQKPQCVIDAVAHYYLKNNANVHRGVYDLSQRATDAYEAVRDKVVKFINAKSRAEIIFTKGTTDAINLVAASFGALNIGKGDEILISTMEHHSNIVPWQLLCERTGATLKVIPIFDDGTLDLEAFKKLLSERTKLLGLIHVSNVLGTVNPVKEMTALARQYNIPVLLDGAQAVPHMQVDVQALDCDFYVFSSHKMYGPTGVGVLYGKEKWLEKMPPYQGGGDMIRQVSFEKTEYNTLPYKFEAGTPNMAGVVGFGRAIDFITMIGFEKIAAHEDALTDYAEKALRNIPGVRIIGEAADKVGVFSFVMEQAHPHDIGTILDSEGVAIRVGHHCAMPLMTRFNLPATARASFGLYNEKEDIDALVKGIHKVVELFGCENV